MVVDIPFNYTCLLAFKTLLSIGNERKLSIDKIIKYREKLLNLSLEDYFHDDRPIQDENWSGKISFKKINYDQEIVKFLKEYKKIFSIKNGVLSLKEEITKDFLDELIFDFDVSSRIYGWSSNYQCLEILGIDTFKNLLSNLVNLEENFEKCYANLSTKNVDREIVKKIHVGLMLRKKLTDKLKLLKDDVLESFYYFVLDMVFDNEKYNYRPFPIDVDNYAKSKYFTDEENLHTTLFKPYLYAIFGDKDLALLAVFDTIEKIYDMKGEIFEENVLNNEGKDDGDSHFLDDEEDVEWISLGNEDENIFTSWNEEEFAFYLKFIDNINRILITYGKNDDLLNTKYRLLFILDKEGLCLFDEVNFYTTLDRVLEFDFHDEAFDFFEKEAKFFIEEVFNNNVRYDYTIKKLLFIRTYYELTGDKEIIDVFNKYKNCDSYNEFYNIVFDKNSYIRKRHF